MHLGRQVFEKIREYFEYRLGLNDVEIIQNEHEWIGNGSQFIGELVDGIFKLRRLDPLEHAGQVGLNAWRDGLEGGCQILQETARVVIAAIQGEPGGPHPRPLSRRERARGRVEIQLLTRVVLP